jgi:hypothetical protein
MPCSTPRALDEFEKQDEPSKKHLERNPVGLPINYGCPLT